MVRSGFIEPNNSSAPLALASAVRNVWALIGHSDVPVLVILRAALEGVIVSVCRGLLGESRGRQRRSGSHSAPFTLAIEEREGSGSEGCPALSRAPLTQLRPQQGSVAATRSGVLGALFGKICEVVHLAALSATARTGTPGVSIYVSPGPMTFG